jgi:Tfp pilus assembly protein PilV
MATAKTQHPSVTRSIKQSSVAFFVESLLMLVFLVASLAIVTQIFAASANRASQSQHLERAVIVAANTAEQFSANPTGVAKQSTSGELATTCAVTSTHSSAGTIYNATITVSDETGEIYTVKTSRYVSGGAS